MYIQYILLCVLNKHQHQSISRSGSICSRTVVCFTTISSCSVKPKFQLLRHDTHDVVSWRSVSWRACRAVLCSNMADDEEAVVFACTGLIFCALDLHQSWEQLWEKWSGHVHPSPCCGDAPEHVSCESRSSWRACRAVLFNKRDTAHYNFSCTKMHGPDSVSWRDATSGIRSLLAES